MGTPGSLFLIKYLTDWPYVLVKLVNVREFYVFSQKELLPPQGVVVPTPIESPTLRMPAGGPTIQVNSGSNPWN